MAKLKPWYQVVTPREDLRENRPLDASEFAVHLDHIRENRAHDDYIKPNRFFDRTYLTKSLMELASQVVRRLSGIKVETSAVFNMATQFGGGKTHALTALYHLAKHGDDAKGWKGVDSILSAAQVKHIPKASVAVFVGNEFDVLKGRGGDGEPVRKTPWGELAWQLGKQKGLDVVAEHDAKGIAPAGDVLRAMLPDGPTLILMDEILNYVSRGRKMGLRDQFFNFLQNLSEEARARDNCVLCVSIPASELEMNPEDQRDQDSLKKVLDRLGKAIIMSAETEVPEIIRRRLFEWSGLPEEARKTAAAYAEWIKENAASLGGINTEAAYDEFAACYPFHPSVLSVFQRKWQTLPRFQRTRGVLRMLALWISRTYQEEHREASRAPLITLGSAPLDDPMFRAAIFEQLGADKLEGPVTTDIVGKKDAHAVRLDHDATEAIRKAHLHQKTATVIFFESNGGQSQSKAEATVPEIKTAVGEPDLILAEVDQALESLVEACYYLGWDRNRYRFSTAPNLNQMLVNKRAGVSQAAIEARVRSEIETLFKAGSQEIDRRYFPTRSNDVPDRPALTLVVLGIDTVAGEANTAKLMETILRESGSSGRTFKSALIFAAADSAAPLSDATRNMLAWEDIDDDDDSKKRLDDAQQRQLTQGLGRAKSDLKEAGWRTYRHLFLLGRDNKLREINLGQITSSAAGNMVELILRELHKNEEITDGVSPSRLLKYWPPACVEWATKSVRDAFYSSPLLPRLLRPDTVKRTISDGVSQGLLGYGRKDAQGQFTLERYAETLPDDQVEIADDVFIITGDEAKKRKEPPRLARLTIRPERVTISPGEQVAFSVVGADQYGGAIAVNEPAWHTTGGDIDANGLFVAGAATGVHNVRAVVGTLEAMAEVRVQAEAQDGSGGGTGGGGGGGNQTRKIRWTGTVPPQKWMNLYTKVLSRFASSPDLKLTVCFEIPADSEQAEGKIEQARAGLRDLGLDDNVSNE